MNHPFALFVCVVSLVLGLPASRADEPLPGIPIPFKHLDNPAIRQFARSYFEKELRGNPVDKIADVLHDTLYSEFDLNDDGIPELLLIVDKGGWCGEAGCEAHIFRRTPKGYELICPCSLPPPLPDGRYGPRLLPQTENGYHVIDAAESIIHWHATQKYNSGQLCEPEDLTQ